jgi:hypothetical protein
MQAEQLSRVGISPEALEAELNQIHAPDFVKNLRVSWGQDATGDEAVWVWMRVPEGVTAQAGAMAAIKAYKKQIQVRVFELAPGVWPYFRLEN